MRPRRDAFRPHHFRRRVRSVRSLAPARSSLHSSDRSNDHYRFGVFPPAAPVSPGGQRDLFALRLARAGLTEHFAFYPGLSCSAGALNKWGVLHRAPRTGVARRSAGHLHDAALAANEKIRQQCLAVNYPALTCRGDMSPRNVGPHRCKLFDAKLGRLQE
jgi:hypothetical protein